MSDFDEFADLEKELNEEIRFINAEDIVREIEENKSDLFFIIQRQAVSGGPVRKIMGLIVGILLIPLFGFGIYQIWAILSSGPINEHTTRVVSEVYSKKYNSIIEYRLILNQENIIHKISRSKINPLGKNAIIELDKVWSDNMGGHTIYCWIKSEKDRISLPYYESDSSVIGSGIEVLFVGERLDEFAKFANLKIVSS